MNPENPVHSGMSQTQKDKHYMISLSELLEPKNRCRVTWGLRV